MGKHLRYEQRCEIYALAQRGLTQEAIAQKINSTQSVVSRELKRNRGRRGYRYKQAQAKADERRHIANAVPSKMTPEVIAVIETMLRDEQLSPEPKIRDGILAERISCKFGFTFLPRMASVTVTDRKRLILRHFGRV